MIGWQLTIQDHMEVDHPVLDRNQNPVESQKQLDSYQNLGLNL